VVKTNRYCRDYADTFEAGPSPEPAITEAKMSVFLALTIQVAHCLRDKLTHYWATMDQLYTPLYGTVMKRGRYLHILRYLRFTDIRNKPDRTGETFGRVWKVQEQFEILNWSFSKFYSPSENLPVEVMVPSKEGSFQTILCFGIKIFKLCDSTGCMYDMKMAQCSTVSGHAVAQLVEAPRHKLAGCGFDFRWCHWNFSVT
jgi:hypothetical protein